MRRLLLFLALLASCTWARQFEMTKNYNKEDPPPFTKGMNKTFIQATFNLRNILEMSESLQRISLEVRFPIPNYFQWFLHQSFFFEGVSHSFLVRHKAYCEQDPVARRG